MKPTDVYTDVYGTPLALDALDDDERKLVALLRRKARVLDWNRFGNFATAAVRDFYHSRGMTRKRVIRTIPWKIAQDLEARIGIAAGLVREPDYRDAIECLIRDRFKSQADFCRQTGLSETLVSHVLARRKHLAIDTLSKALEQVGCRLSIVTVEQDPPRKTRTGTR